MANYNYVAPIQYKTYSDMNKERLALKAAQDAAKLKQQGAGSKQRQKYLDQLSGLKTDGWSTAHRAEFEAKVKEARNYVLNTPINELDFGAVSDALVRMQGLGDSHAKLRDGQTTYESFLGPNALEPEEDSWDMETSYSMDGHAQRLGTFNNVGLINYNNGIGDFPNPNYNPQAPAGSPESMRTMREVLSSQEGVTIKKGPDGKDYANVNGQMVAVNGGAFDVAEGGFGNLWNPDKNVRDTIAPNNAFLNFKADGEGASIFNTLANEYATSVKNGQLTQDAAYDKLKGSVLTYLTGQDPSLSLRASAIKMWEEKHNMEWSTMDEHNARTGEEAVETPWDLYAEAVANEASLKPKPAGAGSDSWNAQTDLWKAVDTNAYIGLDQETTGFVIGDPAIAQPQWDDMLERNLGRQLEVGESIHSIRLEIEGATEKSLNVSIPQGSIKYDGQYIDRVTYHPEDDYVIIWRTDPDQGEQGPLPEGSAWAYTKTGLGEPKALAFQVIYKWKDGLQPTYNDQGEITNGAELTQQYRNLRSTFKIKMPEDISGTDDPLQFLFDKAAAE
jgi:hypothetical protein